MFFGKTFCVFGLLCLLVFCSCKSTDEDLENDNSGTVSFVKTFGGSLNDSGQSIVSTMDGGYAILGYTQSNDGDVDDSQNSNYKYWLLKFDSQDLLQWSKTYGGIGDDRGSTLIQTVDGGFALLGSSSSLDGDVSQNAGSLDYWLNKVDSNGIIQWKKSFGYQGIDNGISLIQTSDQGYLLVGVLDVTASGGAGNSNRSIINRHAGGDYWAIKLNSNGDTEWSRYYGGNFTDTPEDVIQLIDGGFIIVGGSDSTDTDISSNIGSYDFWVLRISSNGDLIWEKSFGGDEIDEARAIVATSDGNFLIAGDTRSINNDVSSNNGAADLWMIKINSNGDLLWEKTIGGSSFDVSRAMVMDQFNGFILAGSSRSSDGDVKYNKGQNDAWIVKVDLNGDLQWEVTLGGANIDFAYGITQLNDGAIVAVGDTSSVDGDIVDNKGFTDLLIVKLKN